ncbi:MAG TPA: hypothetical protein VFG49_08350 [Dyella sp.]|uniref:hypothetical protein n=1 Tax=Dyella sp. TaxID=1869338 RepID=UPI002D7915FF|nr:hypothetical protein [Dyella sp.]HET6553533.1 hypothetical protein [Dyella sp.]
MSSLWTNLLFLHGHIADLELARRLADISPPSLPSGKRTGSETVLPGSPPQTNALALGQALVNVIQSRQPQPAAPGTAPRNPLKGWRMVTAR